MKRHNASCVDAVLKIMSVLTQDSRFEEAQNKGKRERDCCKIEF